MVEQLVERVGISDARGAVAEFQISEYDYMVVFKGPGYAADIFIDRESGSYTVTETSSGTMAVLNDLHKGRDSGA
ncbi:MAG: PepSY-associated TM helix domain-containing protein, partial [Planctomycetota bacterium]